MKLGLKREIALPFAKLNSAYNQPISAEKVIKPSKRLNVLILGDAGSGKSTLTE